jgi:uncharacterized protein YbbC (DUF1343 family)
VDPSPTAEPTVAPTVVPTATPAPTVTPTPQPVVIRTGAEALADSDFALLVGRRVGVIANQASLIDGRSTAGRLSKSPQVDLVAIFAPEHGVTGTAGPGDLIEDQTDPLLDIPVYSLYGSSRAPDPAALAEIDVLVYDLQDVGTRFYTFISTLGLAMQAAAAADVAFVVLDRPNPHGDRVSGPLRDADHVSFVSQYPIPITYGMTAGELARAIVGERWLEGLDALDLIVVPVEGWDRSAPWPRARLGWVPPSPSIPTVDSALAYPGMALFEATEVSEGRGTVAPFTTVGAPWVDGPALAATLNEAGLPGVRFEATTFTPRQLETLTARPRFDGEELGGVSVVIEDPALFRPVETGVHALVAVQAQARALGRATIVDRPDGFGLLSGTSKLGEMLESGVSADEIIAAWAVELDDFAEVRQAYLIY